MQRRLNRILSTSSISVCSVGRWKNIVVSASVVDTHNMICRLEVDK